MTLIAALDLAVATFFALDFALGFSIAAARVVDIDATVCLAVATFFALDFALSFALTGTSDGGLDVDGGGDGHEGGTDKYVLDHCMFVY